MRGGRGQGFTVLQPSAFESSGLRKGSRDMAGRGWMIDNNRFSALWKIKLSAYALCHLGL